MKKIFSCLAIMLLFAGLVTIFTACGKTSENDVNQNEETPSDHTHVYGEWSITENSSCQKEGSRQRICSICGFTQKETISKSGHIFNQKNICTVCGYELEFTTGLNYEEYNSGSASGYIVSGIGNANDQNIIVPSQHAGKPVYGIKENAFKGNDYIHSVYLPQGVEFVEKNAFNYCISLKSFRAESLTKIGEFAFGNCSALKDISLSDTITSFSATAFEDTGYYSDADNWENGILYIGVYAISSSKELLSSVNLRAGTIYLCNELFKDQSKLTDVTLPDTLTLIGDYAFSGCSSLTSIVIPDRVTSINDYAFYRCSSLQNITIPSSVKSIGYCSFHSCTALKEFVWTSTRIDIGAYAFGYCKQLTVLKIINGCIAEKAFYSCSALSDIYLVGGRIEPDIFYECNITKVQCNAYVLQFLDKSKIIDLALTDQTLTSSNSDSSVLSGCSSLKKLTLNTAASLSSLFGKTQFQNSNKMSYSGVYSSTGKKYTIEYYLPRNLCEINARVLTGNMFRGCSNSVIINLDAGIKSIPEDTFYETTGLTSITIPDSVTSIGDDAFYNCSSLTSVYYTGDIASWCGITFSNGYYSNPLYYAHNLYINNELIKDIVIPDTVTEIEYQFTGWNGTSITIPDSVTSIGNYAFSGCTATIAWGKNPAITTIGTYTFSGYNGTSITLPESVTSIADRMFSDCSSLTSITIPDSVTSIGERAFYNCSRLTSVYYKGDIASWCGITFSNYYSNPLYYAHNLYINNELIKDIVIPDTVTEIGYQFTGWNGTSITIPNSVTSIRRSAFSGCTATIAWGKNPAITTIGTYAFSGYNGTSITLPDSVTSIGSGAFSGCTATIAWGKNPAITTIGTYAFSGYNGTSITIPDSVTSIGNDAFSSCSSLTSITIPDSVTSIGEDAFNNCSSLTSITLGNSVTSIGGGAFRNCSRLTSVYYTGDIASWCGITFGFGFSHPLIYAHNLYIDNELIKDIVIPDTVTEIKDNAFIDWNGTSITIGNSVTSIGYQAFYRCISLTSITIPDSVTSIGEMAFEDCSSLTSITIPDSVTSIGDWAFSYCINLQYNKYDNGYYLGNDNNPYIILAKAKNTSITSCTIHENTKFIHSSAFYNCNSLKSVTIGNSVKSIGGSAFYKCSSLTSITIPASVTSIGSGAFSDCSKLTSITIPDSVTSIGSGAFSGCSSLQYNEYDNGYYLGNDNNPYLWLIKAKDTSITSCTIHENTKFIHSSAFDGCRSLRSITLPNSVTSIGQVAFYGCSSLMSITIPDSVTGIGWYAFYGCSSLTSITFQGTIAQWNEISKGSSWNYNTGRYTVHCTDGDISK